MKLYHNQNNIFGLLREFLKASQEKKKKRLHTFHMFISYIVITKIKIIS